MRHITMSLVLTLQFVALGWSADLVTKKAVLEIDSEDPYFIANKKWVVTTCSELLEKENNKEVIVLLRERRGDAYALMKDLKRAKEDWEAGLRLDPKNVRLRFRFAMLSAQVSLARAQKDLEELIAESPDFARAWIGLAAVRMGKGDYEGAIEKASKAIDLSRAAPLAYYTRGSAFLKLHKYKEALEDLNRCIELDSIFPAAGNAYSPRGVALLALGSYKKAANDFARAIQFNGEDIGSYYGLWKCNWAMGRWNLCAVQAKGMFKEFPLDHRSHLTLCSSYLAMGKVQDAVFHGEQAVSIAPNNPDAHREFGLANFYLGKYSIAVESFDRALALAPNHLRSLHSKTVLRATCPEKKYRDGREALKLALTFKESVKEATTDALFLLAISQAENGDFSKALDAGKEFAKKEPTGKLRKEVGGMLERFRTKQPLRIGPNDNNTLPLLFSSSECWRLGKGEGAKE